MSRRSDRGQTPQDFALGIGVFIIAATFAFAFIPTAFTFTGADPGPTEAKQAERVSTALIANLSVGNHQNTLNATATAAYFNRTTTEADLREALSLPLRAEVNVTIRDFGDAVVAAYDANGTNVRLAMGGEYPEGRPAAEVVRIVEMETGDSDCDPACKLVVRVW